MQILEFYARLMNADWFYHYSDDMRAYSKGDEEMKNLIKTAIENGSEYIKMFNAVAKQKNFSTIGGNEHE